MAKELNLSPFEQLLAHDLLMKNLASLVYLEDKDHYDTISVVDAMALPHQLTEMIFAFRQSQEDEA